MNLEEPNPMIALDPVTRARCTPCELARSSWASGGYHLSCRAWEIGAVSDRPSDDRQAFYSRLVAEAGAARSGRAA